MAADKNLIGGGGEVRVVCQRTRTTGGRGGKLQPKIPGNRQYFCANIIA